MTDEEAIYVLEMNNPFMGGKEQSNLSKAMDIAIDALKRQSNKNKITNKEKFKEVFGFETVQPVCPIGFYCGNISCVDCVFDVKWWNKEYKPCFKLKE